MENSNNHNYAIILAGGIGNRLWPLSTPEYPKQFIDLLGDGCSLILHLYKKVLQTIPKSNIYVVANEKHTNIVKEQLSELPLSNLIEEPLAKNTAATVAYACFKIQKQNPNASVLILPSDLFINKEEIFRENILSAFDKASISKEIIVLGIKPTSPDTSFTYIQRQEKSNNQLYRIKTFTEHPNNDLAKIFFESGDFLWNSKIVVAKVDIILEAYNQILKDTFELFSNAKKVLNTTKEKTVIRDAFEKCPNVAFMNGIVEKITNKSVMESQFECTDVDTFLSLHLLLEKMNKNNCSSSIKTIFDNTSNCYVQTAKNKSVFLSNMSDYVILDTAKSLLIFPKSKVGDIRDMISNNKDIFPK